MKFCPYPGLRPFKKEESKYFFGRKEHIKGILTKLNNHFLMVVGPSGCGKSSLVYAGMIPALEMGFLASAGEKWRVATLRPGASPMRNLAESLYRALADPDVLDPGAPVDDTALAFMMAALRRGPSRLAEGFREARLPQDVKLLVLVDQFEEIFRYRDQTDADEADSFVELLLAPEREAEDRIYVALTMRSDFLGDCAVFRGLPEAMNDSQFLTPRLTREQRRAAITGPAGVAGFYVEPALVNRVLNEMGDEPDQLPLMQHCLMRMWGMADGNSLSLRDYEKTGGLEKALSNHADAVYHKLTGKQKRIAEIVFKRLTYKSENNKDTRRPVRIKELADVAEVSFRKAVEVVEAFRSPGTNFLTSQSPLPLERRSFIDISHESLIRQWGRLAAWVKEEAESAETYKRLEKTAVSWRYNEAGLWRTPDLDNAKRWKNSARPNREWAKRYGDNFDLAMTFLEASEEQRKKREKAKKKKRKQGIIILLIALLITLLFLFDATYQRRQLAIKNEELEDYYRRLEELNRELGKIAAAREDQMKMLKDLRKTNVAVIGKEKFPSDPIERIELLKNNLLSKIAEYPSLSEDFKNELLSDYREIDKKKYEKILDYVSNESNPIEGKITLLERYINGNSHSDYTPLAKELLIKLKEKLAVNIKRISACEKAIDIINDPELTYGLKIDGLNNLLKKYQSLSCEQTIKGALNELKQMKAREKVDWFTLNKRINEKYIDRETIIQLLRVFISKYDDGEYVRKANLLLERIRTEIRNIEQEKVKRINLIRKAGKRFTIHGDVIKDNKTGLHWTLVDSSVAYDCMDYEIAETYKDYMNRSGYGGIKSWQLPSANQLADLYHSTNPYPMVDKELWFWSANSVYQNWLGEKAEIVSNINNAKRKEEVRKQISKTKCAHVHLVARVQ